MIKVPFWIFEERDDGEFWIMSRDSQHWCDVPKEGGTSPDFPQQRSIGRFLVMCSKEGWLDEDSN